MPRTRTTGQKPPPHYETISREEADAVARWLGRRMMRHSEFARGLGIHPRTVRRVFTRGGLPGAVEHGPKVLMVPTHLFRLASFYGLRGVERMAQAGLLGSSSNIFRH